MFSLACLYIFRYIFGGVYMVVHYSINALVQREPKSQIHEHTSSLRFLGLILRVLRFEVSVQCLHITNQFQPTFAQRVRGGE
jgi:hypothetical protein